MDPPFLVVERMMAFEQQNSAAQQTPAPSSVLFDEE